MKIQVLGGGCANCGRLEENARKACEALGVKADILKVTDFGEIAVFGIMSTPALVVDGKVKVEGRVPNVEELKKILKG